MTVARAPSRKPQQRVLSNTERILDAAERLVLAQGWHHLAPTSVAREAALSQRAVQSRFRTRSDLVRALWLDRCESTITESLEQTLVAAGLLDDGFAADAHALDMALTMWAEPSRRLTAATELLLVAPFDGALESAVNQGVGARLVHWCTPLTGGQGNAASRGRALAAQRAYLLAMALGLSAVRPLNLAPELSYALEAQRLLDGIDARHRPQRLPARSAVHMRSKPAFGTDDPMHEALLTATLEQVGQHGFDGATTRDITEAAGCSEGYLFARYSSKLELFLEASRAQIAGGFAANEAFMTEIAAAHGRGVAEAVMMREFMSPKIPDLRTITIEQLRVAWHDDALRETTRRETDGFLTELRGGSPKLVGAEAHFYVGYGLGIGTLILARLVPDAWTLPFDVMTVPLLDHITKASS